MMMQVFDQRVLTLGMLVLLASAQSQTAEAQANAANSPSMTGLDGYCPVCVIKGKGWVKGDPGISSTYDGKTYYFPSADVKAMFDASPEKYVPALGGDCVVCLKKIGKRVPGSVRHASMTDGRLFLFPDEKTMEMFKQSPSEFTSVDLASNGECTVCQVEMNKAVKGLPQFTAIHDGMRYLFPGEKQKAMFVSNPRKYTAGSETASVGAYLAITLMIDAPDRGAAAGVYKKYKQPFLDQIPGAISKTLLVRDSDVQVLHGFASAAEANAYLSSSLFTSDVVTALKPYLKANPDVRVYTAVE